MGDSVQDQLAKLFNLLLAEQQANKDRNDKVEQLHAKLDAMSQELEFAKKELNSSSVGSQAKSRRDKGVSGTSVSETSGGSSIVPKFTKLDFPRYDGQDDPLGWLSRCQHFFRHQQTPEEEKVSLASYHLEGIAQLWYMQLLDDTPNPNWDEFSQQCNLRFGPPIRSNKLGELAKLKQTGSVAEYQNRFEALVSRAGSLTQNQKVQLYLSGLQDSIAVEVELHHPTDLVNAMSISSRANGGHRSASLILKRIAHKLSVSLNKIGDLKYYDAQLEAARDFYVRSLDLMQIGILEMKMQHFDRFRKAIQSLESLTLRSEETNLEQCAFVSWSSLKAKLGRKSDMLILAFEISLFQKIKS